MPVARAWERPLAGRTTEDRSRRTAPRRRRAPRSAGTRARSIEWRTHDHRVGAITLGDIAARGHLRLDRGIGRVPVVRIGTVVPQAVDRYPECRAPAVGIG